MKTCFVRRKRFSWNKTVCDVDDLVILSRGARRVELDCAGPPHWRGSPPFSGANASSAHSTRRACARCCYFRDCRLMFSFERSSDWSHPFSALGSSIFRLCISYRLFQPDFSSFHIHQDIAIPDKHNFIYVFSP